jgi:hypothetical protein
VDELLAMSSTQSSVTLRNALYHSTLTVLQALYGPGSSQESDLRAYLERLAKGVNPRTPTIIDYSFQAIKGVLEAVKAELDAGFVGSLRATLAGEILTDLVKLARATLEEAGDNAKNVAAVLTAAAFEDVMRKLSDLKGNPRQNFHDVYGWLSRPYSEARTLCRAYE